MLLIVFHFQEKSGPSFFLSTTVERKKLLAPTALTKIIRKLFFCTTGGIPPTIMKRLEIFFPSITVEQLFLPYNTGK